MTSTTSAAHGQAGPLADLPDLEGLSRYDESGRQYPADIAAIEGAVVLATGRLARADAVGGRDAALALLGYLGNAHRLLGETDVAIQVLARALTIARDSGNTRAEVITLIRLGESVRYGGRPDDAEPHYREALSLIQANPKTLAALEDFALQHLGKCRMEQGKIAGAIACFERALALRRAKGDPALIASTEAALAYAKSLGS